MIWTWCGGESSVQGMSAAINAADAAFCFSPLASTYYAANQLGALAKQLSDLRQLRHENGTCTFKSFVWNITFVMPQPHFSVTL